MRRVEEESALEDRKPNKEDLVKESVDAFNGNPPLSKLATGLKNAFIVKQDWIEQYEKRRPPLKERYQLEFGETMQLKMEVLKLRKKVSRLKKKARKYKWKVLKPNVEVSSTTIHTDDVPTTSIATQTSPVEQLFEAREFFLVAEIQKWKSITNKQRKEIERVQEYAVEVFTEYADQLDRAR